MKVPLLDLEPQNAPLRAALMEAVERVVKSGVFILGPEVEKFESLVAAYCGVPYAVGVSSGTDALLAALMALGVGPGDDVVTTPYSFFATAGAVSRLGARPVFVDIDPSTYNMDPEKIAESITPRTKALLPVHLFGQTADMGPILDVAAKKGIPVIEDAAQAIGAEYKDGRRAGSFGRMGCFSFFPTKNLGAFGDGGLVVTSDRSLAEKLRILRVHGSQPKYHHKWIGGNFRLDALQAAVLSVKLAHLDDWTRERIKNADFYDGAFGETDAFRAGNIRLPRRAYDGKISHGHIFNQYVARVKNRDALWKYLTSEGIGAEVYYPIPLHLQECFSSLGRRSGDFPEAERAALETLALPIYPGLTEGMRNAVIGAVETFYERF